MAMSLNHFSIRSLDLDACERFYCGLLGLTKGRARPSPSPACGCTPATPVSGRMR